MDEKILTDILHNSDCVQDVLHEHYRRLPTPRQKSELALSGPDEMHRFTWATTKTTVSLYFSNTSFTNENNSRAYPAWKPYNISSFSFLFFFFVFLL